VAGSSTLVFPPEHPAFAGHFPGLPIVPAVLLLDEVVYAVAQELGRAGSCWRVASAKFVKPVGPGETLTLEHEQLANGTVRFGLAGGGKPVAYGVLAPAAGDDGKQAD
jgi:3-hydroxyacyl-[acyl-carrier-protein] dehydratase